MRKSVESSITSFREAQTGLWAKYSPEELATSQAFRRNPKLVWEWYAWRRELVAQAKPILVSILPARSVTKISVRDS